MADKPTHQTTSANLTKANDFFRYILPKVSRTFAINISLLKGIDHTSICCAYLICRILDTIEDDPHLKDEKKIRHLLAFAKIWKAKKKDAFLEWGKKIPLKPLVKEEEILVKRSAEIFEVFFSLPPSHQKAIHEAVLEMATGMALFIKRYSNKKTKHLATQKELQQYCYYVAGTIGKLLTSIFCLKIKNKNQQKNLKNLCVDFGQGLQMVNILKDCWRDQKRNWIYIPKEIIKKHGLNAKQFLNRENPKSCQKIYQELISQTEAHLKKSIFYIECLPRSLYRYRLFCLLPLAMALKTLVLLKRQNFAKDTVLQDKISRKDIRLIIAKSYILAPSNSAVRAFCQSML